jgi:predicted lipid-binding transport protein (Tim44 family)
MLVRSSLHESDMKAIMGNGFEYLDIVFLALIAGFIGFRLWSVLGQRTGHEQSPDPLARPKANPGEDNVVPLPGRADPVAGPGAENIEGVTAVQLADRGFEPANFIEGARWAYELIVGAFAKGDEAALRPLVAPDVFAGFAGVIAKRKAAGHTVEETIVALKEAKIEKAAMVGRNAEVSVRFVADVIAVTRDAAGNVVEGHPTAVRELSDVWTFARDTRSRDPNWTLIATAPTA